MLEECNAKSVEYSLNWTITLSINQLVYKVSENCGKDPSPYPTIWQFQISWSTNSPKPKDIAFGK